MHEEQPAWRSNVIVFDRCSPYQKLRMIYRWLETADLDTPHIAATKFAITYNTLELLK